MFRSFGDGVVAFVTAEESRTTGWINRSLTDTPALIRVRIDRGELIRVILCSLDSGQLALRYKFSFKLSSVRNFSTASEDRREACGAVTKVARSTCDKSTFTFWPYSGGMCTRV